MAENLFLIATIDAEATFNSSANWITTSDMPYSRLDPIDIPDSLLSELFQAYIQTYKPLGERMHINEGYQLLDYNRWILVRNKNGKLIAFILFKTTIWGLKLIACGADESKEAKRGMLSFLTKALNVKSVYGEVSPPLEDRLIDVPKVPVDLAKKVLGKDIEPQADGYHYLREIKNIGYKKKLLVGKPDRSQLGRSD